MWKVFIHVLLDGLNLERRLCRKGHIETIVGLCSSPLTEGQTFKGPDKMSLGLVPIENRNPFVNVFSSEFPSFS